MKSLWILLTLMIIVTSQVYSSMISNFISNNKLRFESVNDVIQLDIKTRTTINIRTSAVLVLFQLFYVDFYGYMMPPPVEDYITGQIRGMQASLNKVYNTTNLLGIFIGIREANLKSFSDSIETFRTARMGPGVTYDPTLDYLTTFKVNISSINDELEEEKPVYQAPILEALLSNVVRGNKATLDMKAAEPYMIGKEPPFNMDSSVQDGLINLLLEDTAQLRNIAGSLLGGLETLVGNVASSIVNSELAQFTTWVLLLSSMQAFFNLCCLLVAIYGAWLTNRHMKAFLLMYQLLKVNEVESHIEYFSSILARFSKNGFNENKLVGESYGFKSVQSTKSPTSSSKSPTSSIKSPTNSIKKGQNKTKRVAKVTGKILFSSAVCGMTLMLLQFVAVGVYLACMTTVAFNVREIIPKEEFYVKNYRHFAMVSNHYLSYALLSTLGNFIKIDGKYPEEVYRETSSAIRDLTGFWLTTQNQLKNILTPEDAEMIQRIMFEDICPYLPRVSESEKSIHFICSNHLPTKKGVLSFLLSEQSIISDFITNYILPEEQYLEDSKSKFMGLIISPTIFQESCSSIRALHDPFLELFNDVLFERIRKVLSEAIKSFSRQVFLIQTLSLAVLLFFYVVVINYTKRLTASNKAVCIESTFTVRPETLTTNPLLDRLVKLTLSHS